MGNGAWTDWYQRTLRGAEGGTSEPQGPPYLIRTAQVRWEAISQIYNSVDGKDPPLHNIASEALRAYYSGVDPQTLKTWAFQILCMISEYHMACMTRGSPVTSPILLRVIKDRLPPLTDYAPPEDRSGVTDIRVWCTILFAGFLISLCPKCALVWGNYCEWLRVEIFVRVLCSSDVISLKICK